MVAAAIIGGVANIGGGVIAASGARSAANTQAQAAREATAAQTAAADKQIALQEPFRQGGMTAQSRIFELLGLQDPNARAAPTGPEAYGLRAVNIPSFGGFGGATSYVDARGKPVADVKAYMAAHPLPAAAHSADFGKYGRDFGMQDYQADPGYAFRLSEGQKAIERSAAARGGLQSGSALKAAARFGQDLGSQEYQNAFNRYQINRSNQLNPLQSLMGAGQSATNVLTGVQGQLGQNQATNLYNAGAARASGYVGSANALGGALSSIGQTAANYPLYQAQTNYLNSFGGGKFSSPSIADTSAYLDSIPISKY